MNTKKCDYCEKNKPLESISKSTASLNICEDCKNSTTKDLVINRGYTEVEEYWVKPNEGKRVTLKEIVKLDVDSKVFNKNLILEEFKNGTWTRVGNAHEMSNV